MSPQKLGQNHALGPEGRWDRAEKGASQYLKDKGQREMAGKRESARGEQDKKGSAVCAPFTGARGCISIGCLCKNRKNPKCG